MIYKYFSFKALALCSIGYCFFINPLQSYQVLEKNNEYIKNNKNSSTAYSQNPIKSEYLLDSSDGIYVYFEGVKVFSRVYFVNAEGFINLPELEPINVRGKTLEDLKFELNEKYKEYILEPKISITLVVMRPVTFYLSGEIKNPGLYSFTNTNSAQYSNDTYFPNLSNSNLLNNNYDYAPMTLNDNSSSYLVPKLFDALKFGNGISNYADLSNIKLIRNNSIKQGGGKITTTVNIAQMIETGDQSQNIRIYDGDTIIIPKSEKLLNEQLISINQTNLTPNQIRIFVAGNVNSPGAVVINQGSSLVQAIYASGGEKYFTGRIRHVRFHKDGLSEQRYFNFDPKASVNSYKNPIVMDGDVIQINKTAAGKVTEVIKEVSSPILSVFTIFNIFN